MEVTRAPSDNQIVGECLTNLNTAKGIIPGPNFAQNLQELWSSLEIESEYTLGMKTVHEFFHADPYFNRKRENAVGAATAKVEAQTQYIEGLLATANPKYALYLPRFSSRMNVQRGVQIRFARDVSLAAKGYPVTLFERPTVASTKQFIEETKTHMKKEGVEKDVFLVMDSLQDETTYEEKLALAGTKLNGGGIVSLWSEPRYGWNNHLALAGAVRYKNILRVMANVPMKYQTGAMAPTMALFADIMAHNRVFGGSPKVEDGEEQQRLTPAQVIARSVNNVKRHYSPDNGIYNKRAYADMGVTVHGCTCAVDDHAGPTFGDFFAEFRDYLYPACRVHNAASINNELEATRMAMAQGQLRQLYMMKANTANIIQNFFHLDIRGRQVRLGHATT